MTNVIEQNYEKHNKICTSIFLVINEIAWIINISATVSLYYGNFYTYSFENYTGYDSYIMPPWWVIILNVLIQLYICGFNIWLIFAQFSLKQDIKKSVQKIACSLLFHNTLCTIEYIMYGLNSSEQKNITNTNDTVIDIINNYSQGLSILMVFASAIVVGIDIGMMAKLRTFYYSDSKLKTCLLDTPISLLFSWSIVDFIIQLNNILNVSNWGCNDNIEAYYGFIIWITLMFFIVLLYFRNMIAYLFYTILLIGYGTKFYEYDQPMHDRIGNADAYAGSVITSISILISFITIFGYSIHYSKMYSSYKEQRQRQIIVVNPFTTENIAHLPEMGGPFDELA